MPTLCPSGGRSTLRRIPGSTRSAFPAGLPDGIAAQYDNDGVFGLMRVGHDSDYDGVVWRIAQRIAELHYGYYVEPREYGDSNDQRDVFREQP